LSNSNVKRILSILLICLLPLSFSSCLREENDAGEILLWTPDPSEDGVKGNVVEVSHGSVDRSVSGEGTLVYTKSENITCDFFNARLLSVNVRRGDTVKKGDVIAEFSIEYNESDLMSMISELEISEKQFQINLSSFQSMVDAAHAALESLTEQYEVSPSNDLEIQIAKAEINLKKAKAALNFFEYENMRMIESQKKAIKSFEETINNNKILAPFDGVIGSVEYLPVGNIVTPGSHICTLYSPDKVWISTSSDISNGMRYNTPVSIEISVANKVYTGRVITSPDLFDQSTGRVIIIPDEQIDIDPNDRMRRITVKASRFNLDNVLVLPSRAVQNEDGKRFVYLFEDGIMKKRYVTIGMSSLNTVQILDGLTAGQTVVVN
jgi:RND family efflux transporter MFP subunit